MASLNKRNLAYGASLYVTMPPETNVRPAVKYTHFWVVAICEHSGNQAVKDFLADRVYGKVLRVSALVSHRYPNLQLIREQVPRQPGPGHLNLTRHENKSLA